MIRKEGKGVKMAPARFILARAALLEYNIEKTALQDFKIQLAK